MKSKNQAGASAPAARQSPKRHHYVPVTYIRSFCNSDGYLHLYDKREDRVFPSRPENCLAVGHLYRQPVHAESRHDARMENFFSQSVDDSWARIFNVISTRRQLSQYEWSELVEYVAAQHARTFMSLEATLKLLREHVIEAGANVPIGPDLSNVLQMSEDNSVKQAVIENKISINVDPHRALSSMSYLVKSMAIFQSDFSFGVPHFLHNRTKLPFLTSDNPVVHYFCRNWVDPKVPYGIGSSSDLAFIFPVSPNIVMVNSRLARKRDMHEDLNSVEIASNINRIISRFAYRYIVSANPVLAKGFGTKWASKSPVPDYASSLVSDGHVKSIAYKFGQPSVLTNSWSYGF